jgi:GDPmannose 4,6-dehydratase
MGLQKCLFMGNIDAKRDWGHAKDFVEMQWLMLQQDQPDDYVIATGVQYSVREFIEMAAHNLGFEIAWRGQGVEETGYVSKINNDTLSLIEGSTIIAIDPSYYRPTEVETLLGDPGKAKKQLGWTPKITLQEMVSEMAQADLEQAKRHALLRQHGYQVDISQE